MAGEKAQTTMDTKGVKPETPTKEEAAAGKPAVYGNPADSGPGAAPEAPAQPAWRDRSGEKTVIPTEDFGTYVEEPPAIPDVDDTPVNVGNPVPGVVGQQPGESLSEAGDRIKEQTKEADKAAKAEEKAAAKEDK